MRVLSLVAAALIAGVFAITVPQDAEAGGKYKRYTYEAPSYYGTYPYYAAPQPRHYGYSGGTGTYGYPQYYYPAPPPPYYGDVVIVRPKKYYKKYYKRLRKARRYYYYDPYYD